MEIDPSRFSCFIINSGFQYSSEDVSDSIYRGFERVCGSEHTCQFQTKSGLSFCRKLLSTWRIFENKEMPSHDDVTQLLSDPILRYVIQTQPDLVLVVHGANINTEVIDCLKSACPNTRTAVWLVDDPMQIDLSEELGKHFDYVFTNEKNAVKIHGEDKAFNLPLAFNDEVFDIDPASIPDSLKKDILISGSIYPERYDFIEELYEYIKSYDVSVVGKIIRQNIEFTRESLKVRYTGHIVPLNEMAHHMAGAKICLDIPRRQDFSEYGRTNTRNITASYLNPRIYETASVGSLILTSTERDEIKDFFEEDEYVTYNDVDDCANKIIYYLENEEERKKIAEKAKLRVWQEHRYIDRAKKIIELLPEKPLNTRIHGLNLSQDQQNEIVVFKNKDIWEKNLRDNVEFADVGTLNEFNDCGEGRVALIISNGPSFEDQLDELCVRGESNDLENVDIFTVNSAYKEIRGKTAIVPKFHVQIHPTENQAMHFEDVPQGETIFLASILLNNKVIHAWIGEKRVFMPAGTLKMGLEIPSEYENKLSLIESALAVSFTSTAISCHFGYKKIGLLGFDFSFVNNKKYAYENCNFDDEIKNGFIVRKDVNDAPVISTYVMIESCEYMIKLTHGQADIEFHNVSCAGLFYGDKIRQTSLEDFLNDSNGR